MTPFESKSALAQSLKNKARTGVFDGSGNSRRYTQYCSVTHHFSGTNLAYTRDLDFRPPRKVLHLSLSFFDIESLAPVAKNTTLTEEWLDLFFGDHKKLLLVQPPQSEEGIKLDVWHYRLNVHSDWSTPVKGESE